MKLRKRMQLAGPMATAYQDPDAWYPTHKYWAAEVFKSDLNKKEMPALHKALSKGLSSKNLSSMKNKIDTLAAQDGYGVRWDKYDPGGHVDTTYMRTFMLYLDPDDPRTESRAASWGKKQRSRYPRGLSGPEWKREAKQGMTVLMGRVYTTSRG